MCFPPQSVIRSSRIVSLICLGFTVILSVAVVAQQTPTQQTNATALIGQMSSAFSGGQVIQQITLSGNATWQWTVLNSLPRTSKLFSAEINAKSMVARPFSSKRPA